LYFVVFIVLAIKIRPRLVALLGYFIGVGV
jgi:hypothetical protein